MVQTVVETPVFLRRAEKLLGQDEHADLTPDQRKSVASFAAAIKNARKRK